jgi:hypothetical protein
MTDPINQLAAAPATTETRRQTDQRAAPTWFEAFARAWGRSMDQKADEMIATANEISTAQNDRPSNIAALTATSLQFGYLSQAQNTSVNSVGEGLKTVARKQ